MKVIFENNFKNMKIDQVTQFYCIDCYAISVSNQVFTDNKDRFIY